MTGAFRVVGAYCAFGKLPSHADFVRIGACSELFGRFDGWLTDSVEWAHARTGAIWRDAFRAGTMRAFIYRGNGPAMDQTLVVGALAPSRDEAGRLFPMCVGTSVIPTAEFVQNPHLLPFACESIWQAAGESLAELGLNPSADLTTRLAGLAEPSVVCFNDAAAAYAAWGETMQLSELATLILGSGSGSGQVDALRGMLRLLYEAVQPHRNQELPSTPLSLRLPLGAAGGAAVCFWLDAVRSLLGWRATVPSLFWSQDGDSGKLTVHLGFAPPATVSELWLPDARSDEFCDLAPPLSVAMVEALAPLPGAIEQSLSDPSGSVAGLLAALAAAK